MIRKLRIKLIFASMFSLLLVLAVIFGVVGSLNYKKIVTDADSILAILEANDGNFPISDHSKNEIIPEDDRPKDLHRFSPELPYESRYFSVFLRENGEVATVNTGKIAAVDTATAIEYAQTAIRSGNAQGFIEDYRYTTYLVGNETHIIFWIMDVK